MSIEEIGFSNTASRKESLSNTVSVDAQENVASRDSAYYLKGNR